MYRVSLLSKDSNDFIQTVRNTDNDLIGLSKAICETLVLPNVEITDYDDFFINNHSATVRNLVGMVNEVTVIKTDFVLDTCKALWRARLFSAYPQLEKPFIVKGATKCCDVFGFGSVISQDLYNKIQNNSFEIMEAYLGFKKVIKDFITEKA